MIRNPITLKQLEALVAISDAGSFRKAATVLGTTQPNISVRVAGLEETLGVTLMQRDPGSVRLTEQGQEILEAAREVLHSTERLLEVANRRDLVTERMRLGVTELVAATWLHDFLRHFRHRYPSIRVDLMVDLSTEIEARLVAGQLDLALQTAPFRTKMTGQVDLGEHPYGWVAAPGVAEKLGMEESLAAALEVGLLSHGTQTRASQSLAAHLQEEGLAPDRVAHCSSLSATLQMAIDGMGVALLPQSLSLAAVSRGELRVLDLGWNPEPLGLAARYDAKTVPRFVAEAAETASEVAVSA